MTKAPIRVTWDHMATCLLENLKHENQRNLIQDSVQNMQKLVTYLPEVPFKKKAIDILICSKTSVVRHCDLTDVKKWDKCTCK